MRPTSVSESFCRHSSVLVLVFSLAWGAAACSTAGRAPYCGDGHLDANEDCDRGSENGGSACCTAACQLAPSTTVCRAGSGDMCDPPEVCTGAADVCPPDFLQPATIQCRDDADGPGGCDVADFCPYVPGEPCPDRVVPDGTPCAGNGVASCSAADTCLAGACGDNNLTSGTLCGPGTTEPTCNPDACSNDGVCLNVTAAANGTLCADNGGNTCCSARCLSEAQPGVCSDPCLLPTVPAQRVAIIQSLVVDHDMEHTWNTEATTLGMTPTLLDPSVLDSLANLANYDLLVVASGVQSLSPTAQATVRSFVESGRGTYLQSEYQATYTTNVTFTNIVLGNGGTFAWTGEVAGDLGPLPVSGCFAQRPEAVSALSYYWYGQQGTGTPTAFLSKNGQNVAFAFCLPSGALLVTSTDQDWLRTASINPAAQTLARNILGRIAFPCQ